MSRWSRRTRIIALVVAIVVVIGGGLTGWLLTRPKEAASATTTTTTVKASTTTARTTVASTGTLAPQNQSYLNFTGSGTVTAVNVSVGDTVASGQVLATQDTTSLASAVTSAQAAVDSAQSALTALQDSSSSTDTQITAAKATLAAARTKLVAANDDLAGATMTAPFAGVVAQVNIATGDKTSNGSSTTLGAGSTQTVSTSTSSAAQVVLVDTTSWQVNGTVSMSDVASLTKGMTVEIVPDGSTTKLAGTLETIGIVASSSTSSTATFPISVLIEGNPTNLFIGGSASMTIVVSSVQALTVPTAAISSENGQAYVTIRADGKDTKTQVTVGRTFGTTTEITAGVKDGDEIVVTTAAGRGAYGSGTRTPGAGRSGYPSGGASGMPGGGASGMPGGGASGMPGGGADSQPGSGSTGR